MKKLTWLEKGLFLLIAVLTFTACGDDKDAPVTTGSPEGTYQGWAKATFKYMPSGIALDNQKVQITANADGTVKIVYASMGVFGTMTIPSTTFVLKDNQYILAGMGKAAIAPHGGGAATEYDCNVKGSISKDKKTYSLIFTVPAAMGGLEITVNNGSAPLPMLVADVYKGYLTASSAMFAGMTEKDVTVSITANADNKTAKVVLDGKTFGISTIDNVKITKKDANYELEGTGKSLMGMGSGPKKEYDCTLKGTISTTKKAAELTFTAPAVMGGLNMVFKLGTPPSPSRQSVHEDVLQAFEQFFAN